MTTWQHIDGLGAVCFDDTGRVRLLVSDDVADLFDRALAAGVTADQLVNQILEESDREPARKASNSGADPRGPVSVLPPAARLPRAR
jgi:hypothetical protein